jgi:hypothetical protein
LLTVFGVVGDGTGEAEADGVDELLQAVKPTAETAPMTVAALRRFRRDNDSPNSKLVVAREDGVWDCILRQ